MLSSLCLSYLSCTQILVTNQTDYSSKLPPLPLPSKWEREKKEKRNNTNGWREFSLGARRLCSCGMQMHQALNSRAQTYLSLALGGGGRVGAKPAAPGSDLCSNGRLGQEIHSSYQEEEALFVAYAQ